MANTPNDFVSLVSLNTNGFGDKKVNILNKIKRLGCEIACLQETHEIENTCKNHLLRNCGLHLYHCNDKHAGTAILSTTPVEMEHIVPEALRGRVTHVSLSSGIHVFSIYVPTQNATGHYRAVVFLEAFKKYVLKFRKEKLERKN
jgi:exonuclease III